MTNIINIHTRKPYQTPQDRDYECVSRVLANAYVRQCDERNTPADIRVLFAIGVVGKQLEQNTPSNAGVKN